MTTALDTLRLDRVGRLTPSDLLRGGSVVVSFGGGQATVTAYCDAPGPDGGTELRARAVVADLPAPGYGLSGPQVLAYRLLALLTDAAGCPQAVRPLTPAERDAAVLGAVRGRPGCHQGELATATGLSLTAVKGAAHRLLGRGLIRSQGPGYFPA